MCADHSEDVRSQKQKMLAGEPYLADDPELAHDSAVAKAAMAEFTRGYEHDVAAAHAVLKGLFKVLGNTAHIRPPLFVDYGFNISFGEGSFANFGLVALDVAPITIGQDVQIGPNVQLLAPTHPLDAASRRAKLEAGAPIVIEDNVWLGGGAIVLAGITIGENSVIGAGAVVTRDIPANVVAVGNPARVIRQLT
ncbi:sugar O-acetyltransferase [Kushneria marisflavi]|uniref:Nodulation protein L n=1 Tax=Kushneria marisflavi TaxID=157779 RepID=A0A240UQP5_9GAMM|nr:sugar O-acetyltransferase [Kushneria marisflavi]ART63403.1 maltose acetyltransferase [Kushneria marisflavi]RKD84457.1 maltose O-acetyltransferase [Kushneria marisflavi]